LSVRIAVWIGFTVGLLLSADNTAAIATLAAKYGANLYVLSAEITAHIVVVALGWFAGYKMLGYSKLFSLVACFVLWMFGVWALLGG